MKLEVLVSGSASPVHSILICTNSDEAHLESEFTLRHDMPFPSPEPGGKVQDFGMSAGPGGDTMIAPPTAIRHHQHGKAQLSRAL